MIKRCIECNLEKNIELFYTRKDTNRTRNQCKSCVNKRVKIYRDLNTEKRSKRFKQWAEEKNKSDPEWRVRDRLKNYYNITPEEYNLQLEKQNNACYICEKQDKIRLSVDHCHSTGKIRGLLCKHCNQAIGKLDDNIKILQRAIKYLENNGIWEIERTANKRAWQSK